MPLLLIRHGNVSDFEIMPDAQLIRDMSCQFQHSYDFDAIASCQLESWLSALSSFLRSADSKPRAEGNMV